MVFLGFLAQIDPVLGTLKFLNAHLWVETKKSFKKMPKVRVPPMIFVKNQIFLTFSEKILKVNFNCVLSLFSLFEHVYIRVWMVDIIIISSMHKQKG